MNYVEYADDEMQEILPPCGNCGRGSMEFCECCGSPLCPMCMESGAGFCNACPTDDYEPEVQS